VCDGTEVSESSDDDTPNPPKLNVTRAAHAGAQGSRTAPPPPGWTYLGDQDHLVRIK
jgi:hypothetical protein